MKKTLLFTLLICVLATMLSFPVLAEDPQPPVRQPGQCGENIWWQFEDGTLTVSGPDKMDDFAAGAAPWEAHKEEITKVVFRDGVTYVGAYAFYDYDKLEEVDFGDSLYELGQGCFQSCDGLQQIHLPKTFKIFGEDSFRSCRNLKAFHCQGVFPKFKLNCVWDTYATIYYPADRPWGVQYIQQLEEAFKGRIEFLDSNGTDHYTPEAVSPDGSVPVEPPASGDPTPDQETTEPTVPETQPTVPETQPIQQPTQPTVPPTQAPTVPPTQAPTHPAPVPPSEPDPAQDSSLLPLIIIGAVAAFLLIGSGVTILAGGRRKKGRYSR